MSASSPLWRLRWVWILCRCGVIRFSALAGAEEEKVSEVVGLEQKSPQIVGSFVGKPQHGTRLCFGTGLSRPYRVLKGHSQTGFLVSVQVSGLRDASALYRGDPWGFWEVWVRI